MGDGGRLTLTAALVHVRANAEAQHDPIPEGRYVELSVRDTGIGMTAAVKAHIFEPFFTTKAPGKGTGLGLAMVYGTVKQSGGFIAVESEPGQGTTFRLRFPPAAPPFTARVRDAGQREPVAPGEPTILVVEDETAVRNLVLVTLARRGYRVIAASSGQEALSLAAAAGQVDLLLTDANMPGMTGIELVTALVAERPTLQVIVMSGFTEELPRLADIEDQVTLLPKPFTPRELRECVAQALSRQ